MNWKCLGAKDQTKLTANNRTSCYFPANQQVLTQMIFSYFLPPLVVTHSSFTQPSVTTEPCRVSPHSSHKWGYPQDINILLPGRTIRMSCWGFSSPDWSISVILSSYWWTGPTSDNIVMLGHQYINLNVILFMSLQKMNFSIGKI